MRLLAFSVIPALLLSCGRYSAHSDDDDDDGRSSAASCGANAEPVSAYECECEDRFEWCDEAEVDCCAYGTDTFRFSINRAGYLPYKGPTSEEPWDWDGHIPSWLIDALELLGYVVPDAATIAEVLELVDEHAPELLEGTVPPDPYIEFWIDDELVDVFATKTDTYDPHWGDTLRLSLGRSETLYVDFYDEDLAFDDDADSLYAELVDLQYLAGRGPLVIAGPYYLFDIEFEVEPVW